MAGPHSVFSKPLVLPEKQAAHFCQLFVLDNSSVSTLSQRAHQMIQLTEQRAPSELARRWSSRDGRRRSQPDDSLSVEQIVAGYVLLAEGWQTVRLFPHQENGMVSWYSATDELPASMGPEHQKYIHEVFPRLVAEVQAGHWSTVDAYIDRMIQYQCQFGGSKLPPRPSSAAIIGIFLLFFMASSMWKFRCYKFIRFFDPLFNLTIFNVLIIHIAPMLFVPMISGCHC